MKKTITLIIVLMLCVVFGKSQTLSKVGSGIAGVYINDVITMGGKLYAGGYFTPGGVAKDHVYNFSGSGWNSMKGGVSGITFPFITAFQQYNNLLFVCGGFTQAGGFTTKDIAIWDGYTWVDPKGGVESACSFEVYNNQLYVGTRTILSNGGTKAFLWRWTGAGWENLADSFVVEPTSNFDLQGIQAMKVYNGKLVVAGLFKSVNGLEVNNIAAWNGAQWETLGSGTNGQVFALEVWGDTLFAGGRFSNAGGQLTENMAKWHNGGWQGLKAAVDQRITAFEVYNGKLWVGGDFFTPNRGILTYKGGVFSTPFTPDDGVGAFCVDGNSLIIGGNFSAIDGQNFSLIARYTEPGLGVETENEFSVTAYPNPVSEQLYFKIPDGEPVQITIYDNLGKIVKQGVYMPMQRIAVNELPQGHYYAAVQQKNTLSYTSFIKQ